MRSAERDFPVRRLLPVAVFLALAVFAGPAPAQKASQVEKVLDATAARKLLSDRLWHLKPAGGTLYYWTWKSDGSVCVRFWDPNAKCDDTGKWKLDRNRVCYELTWWGESLKFRSACFRIVDRGEGRYGAIEDNDLPFFDFTVAS